MNILAVPIETPTAQAVSVTEDTLTVDLTDGRTLSVPIGWFPRLVHAEPQERDRWRLVGRGQGIHWEDLDEDISIDGLLAGRPSGESQDSLRKWLERKSSLTSALSGSVKGSDKI